jgi:plastocyanin
MQKRTGIRAASVVALAAAAALAVASSAPAGSSTAVTIRHQMHGCHAWSINSGPFKAAQVITVRQGGVLKFTNNDVMPHKLVQTSGPQVRLIHPNMSKMASVATLRLAHKGVYHFTTKAGEDYKWAASMKTTGEDNVLRLTVRVK